MGVEDRDRIAGHVRRMRTMSLVFLATVPAAIAAAFLLPYQGSAVASPMTVTLIAVAAALWIGFSANRDANSRLERIRRSFAVHGDEDRLLNDHRMVYLVILLRLEVMVAAGLMIALWGSGPQMGLFLMLLAVVMIALSWPTARKTQLLLGRARALRESE